MATITTLGANDNGSTSRGVINTNFTNLNTDKIETSAIDTDVTLAADSDTRVASQKAVKAYVDLGGTSVKSLLPRPVSMFYTDSATTAGSTISSNTTLYLFKVLIPFGISLNKITIDVAGVTTGAPVNLALFSEDGQTRLFSVATASLGTTGLKTTNLAAETLVEAGNYYLAYMITSTGNIILTAFAGPTAGPATFNEGVTGKHINCGSLTVTADTMPSTIDPTALTGTGTSSRNLVFRLDN